MNAYTSAIMVFGAVCLIAMILIAALDRPKRGLPPTHAKRTTLEVHVDPYDRIWIQTRTRRRLLPDRRIWVELNNSEARELSDKLHLSAYAAQFHIRSGGST